MKLLTLNLGYYGDRHGDWSARQGLIAEVLRAELPDAVALQAVAKHPDREGGLDQASQLARLVPELGNVTYQTTARHEDGREEGMAFLTRSPVLMSRAHLLSHLEGTEDPFKRALLHVVIDEPGGPLHAYCAHFSWVEAQALDNVTEALPQLSWADGPVILLGDLNQTPDSETARRLAEAGLTDAWATLHPSEPGLTFFEGGRMAKRIDYAWLSEDLAPRLREARIVADAQGGDLRPSDHTGLVVVLGD
ncbi:endonuclease/exonuclease/phosphatase family protein [Deinococcus pimensis]|uniref:endonuclease/exonuclease/phosphatase family protein n=1 Tax=Deinococcus pimensis TaxID=309888 RepID=UPI000484D5F0|nr:endonuclease/exonuclease/phosphatase family protein [Deinococcus pimensis]